MLRLVDFFHSVPLCIIYFLVSFYDACPRGGMVCICYSVSIIHHTFFRTCHAAPVGYWVQMFVCMHCSDLLHGRHRKACSSR